MRVGPWHCDAHAQRLHIAVVNEALGWDMAAFDAWLFSSESWRNFPKVRQQMLDQRMQLARDCNEIGADPVQLRDKLLGHFTQFKRLANQCKNCTPEVKSSFAVPGLKAQTTGTKLSAVEVARIQRQWKHLLDSGQKYGALSLLAKQYGVSGPTIKKVLQLP